jgi:hypothetical protein
MEKEEFIKLVKKEGMDAALSISARDENKDWKCPVCISPIVITGQKEYQTGSEHVTDPNITEHPKRDVYQCTNKECVVNEEKHNVFWNYNGEMYGGFRIDDEEFIGENNSPFGSFQRKLNLEISKNGVLDKKELSPAWCLWFLQPYLQYHYEANEMGDVLKKWYTIEFRKKDDRGEYSFGFHTCFKTWDYLWRMFQSKISAYREKKDVKILEAAFESSFNRAWVYRWFETAMKIRYYILYIKIK